jgi:enamine deaminase RidA (YjgF/YER057c/UK114 family)
VFQNLIAVLTAAGGTFENLVSTTTYLTDIKHREGYNKVRLRHHATHHPTNTFLVVTALANPEFLIEIAGIAVI